MRQSKMIAWLTGALLLAVLLATGPVGAQGFFGGFGDFGGFGGFFGAVEPEPVEEEKPTVAPDGIPIGYQLVAENRELELYLDTEKAQLLVRHKETKKIWRTNPDLDATEKGRKIKSTAADLWLKHMNSQLIVEYTDLKRRTVKTTNNVNEQAVVSYEPINKGVRMVFHMQALGFEIAVEYRLGEGYLEARIPDSLFIENGDYLVVNMDLVPFFGTATDEEEGYLVIPDGPGAVVDFKKEHPTYTRSFQEMAYGPNTRSHAGNLWDNVFYMVSSRRPVPGPYFGLRVGDQAFLGLVTEGEFDVQINAAPAGNVVDLYRACAQFQVRKKYQARLSRSRRVDSIESGRIKADRAVRWYLLTGSDANYIGMANVYRDYLKQKYNIVGRLGLDENDVAPLHLRIIGGVLKDGLVWNTLIKMTTFEQARIICERMLAMGITNFDVTMVGWTEDGVDGIVPRHWPPEKDLGGEKGLREFISWANSKGIKVYLEDNFSRANIDNGGFSTAIDVVRDASKQPIGNAANYQISPLAAYAKFVPKAIPNYKKVGANGIDIAGWHLTLPYDRNEVFWAERADSAKARLAVAQMIKEQLGSVIVQGGNLYFMAVTDKVIDAPVDPSTHVFVDYAIPFFQIVVHGLVPYYGYPGNLRNDPRREFLRMVEWGALPVFELSYQSSELIHDAWRYYWVFSSKFEDWLDTVKDEYEQVNVRMGRLQRLAIVDHGRLADDVFQTVYEDGTRVIVNYQDEEFTVDGITIPALDYVILEGGGSR
ncbi:MAG TPA: hypothetical protein GXX29_05670 [Firmicutes bacterium]|nr:hypothetical protein [Bacillota bacterium]